MGDGQDCARAIAVPPFNLGDRVVDIGGKELGRVTAVGECYFGMDIGRPVWLCVDCIFTAHEGKVTLVCHGKRVSGYTPLPLCQRAIATQYPRPPGL